MARQGDGVSGSSLSIANESAIQAQRPMSIACWVKRTATAGDVRLFNKRNSDGVNEGWGLNLIDSTDVLQFIFFGIGSKDATATITGTAWHFCGARIDASGNVDIYTDLTKDSPAGTIAAPVTSTKPLLLWAIEVGGSPDGFESDQHQCESGVWDVLLDDNHFADMAGGVPVIRIRPDVGRFWPVWGVSSPEPELSGKGNVGTINGTINQTDHAPVGPPFGFGMGWQGAFTAAPPGWGAQLSDAKNRRIYAGR